MSGAFPSAGSTVYYNEAGEPLGWDEPEYDPDLGMGDSYEGEVEWCKRCGEDMGDSDTWLWVTGDPLGSGRGKFVCHRHEGEEGVVEDQP